MEQSVRTVVFVDLTGSTGLFESVGNVLATRIVTRCTQAIGRHFACAGGQVVKYLGDGVLVLFDDTTAAVDAAARVKDLLAELDIAELRVVQLEAKTGIERGPIVEHDGDCYGDAVNVAARLSDLAQPGEILVGESVHACLPDFQRAGCHNLDRITIRGKAEPMRVWRVDWARTAETTLTAPLEFFDLHGDRTALQRIDLDCLDQHLQLEPQQGPLIIGRGNDAGFQVNDQRVSRRHARIEWNGDQCVLTDASSNGTWVRFAGSPVAVMLRRDSCTLNGEGEIGLGATPDDFTAPTLSFRVINDA